MNGPLIAEVVSQPGIFEMILEKKLTIFVVLVILSHQAKLVASASLQLFAGLGCMHSFHCTPLFIFQLANRTASLPPSHSDLLSMPYGSPVTLCPGTAKGMTGIASRAWYGS